MPPAHAFAAAAATWQNFYILVGTAAATLIGLMFVAVTFGASLMTPQSTPTARAFIDPPFAHFVTVLLSACLLLIPTMRPHVLGGALLAMTLLRAAALINVQRRLREAHQKFGDLDLSDWLMGVVLPAACYLGLVATACGFFADVPLAFEALAVLVILILLLGVFGAWELMIWLALARLRAQDAGAQ
jgi:hypothetical protein